MYLLKSSCCLIASVSLFIAAESQSLENINIPKVEGDITLDGKLDEAIWSKATKVSLDYETRPGENTQSPVATTAYVVQNGESLLVAFVAEDPEPSKLHYSFRDRDGWGDDQVGFKVDTFNDGRKAYNFFVNPVGVQSDSIEDDVSLSEDTSWNGIWFSAAHITKTGYNVEIKLPFKVLRFPENSDKWGIDFVRFYPRGYMYRLAHSPQRRDINCFVCQINKAEGFEGIESGRNLEMTPYIVAQDSQTRNPPSEPSWQGEGVDWETGLDLRWGITDSSVLNATINPDFSQVETDAAQLDVNTQFSLFYSEKRPFFLEGAEYFRTPFTLLNTRTIANPDFGAKYIGKNEGHSFGILASRDQQTSFLIPGSLSSSLARLTDVNGSDIESDVFAARYAYDLGEKSQIGGMITHRSTDGYRNSVAAIDGKYMITNVDELRYEVMYSDTENPEQLQQQYGLAPSSDGLGYRVNYSHNGRDWDVFATHIDFDNDFRADLGYKPQVGYDRQAFGVKRNWYGTEENNDFFSDYSLQVKGERVTEYTDQKLWDLATITLNANGEYRSGFTLVGNVSYEFYQNNWFPQKYYSHSGSFYPVNALRVGYNIRWGDGIDYRNARAATYQEYGVYSNWQVTQHWSFGGEWQFTDFDVEQGQLFKADIFNFDTRYQFDQYSYLKFVIRYTDVDYNAPLYSNPNQVSRETIIDRQLLYGYKWNPRTVFYLGYSDNGFEDNTVNQFERTGKTLFSKFSYAFQF
ncbi:hydrolase [Kangiella profundi]|uniref:Hydrolase n=1 Tax=Kangiella profundi TaxID=1561924 RepID=A0A2K9A8M7_9GAMM|nr:carbohydrate binding family 9 domain-containing protein [Kangiella profundi]AUD79080.1 hydrolase [Kangiella profundi]GGF01664.1 hypothetical protein GCM10011356_14210 [Kangiella profundi]